MTVVPEASRQEHNNRKISDTDDNFHRTLIHRAESPDGGIKSSYDEYDARRQTPANHTPSNIQVENSDVSAIMGTRRVDPDDRLLPQQQQVINDHKKPPTQSETNDCDTSLIKPSNVKLQCSTASVTAGAEVQQQNE